MAENIKFIVIKPRVIGNTDDCATSICLQLRNEMQQWNKNNMTLVWARVFFSDIINQIYVIESGELGTILNGCALSCIEQPPTDVSKMSVMLCVVKGAQVETLGHEAKRIITKYGTYIFQSVRFSAKDIKGLDGRQQTILAFERHKALLADLGMTIFDNTVRTWLFVRDIDNTYHDVVKGRNDFFAQNGLTTDTHFIASTGICGYGECPRAIVAVDFLSLENINTCKVKYLNALENLNPTSEYGVAFERGTVLYGEKDIVSFISGTASIDKYGKCIYIGNPKQQTERLIDNIEALLRDAGTSLKDIIMLIVYLRDPSDSKVVKNVIARRLPDIPTVFTYARVCRPQWLVEAECVALKKTK